MTRMDILYEGDLHCRLTHGPSGAIVQTDAPKDNMGKGEAFSPTDLTAVSLGACMLTVMGIHARKRGLELQGAVAQVTKEMIPAPDRRIGAITVSLAMPAGIPPGERAGLEEAGHTCPVRKSLSDRVKVSVSFVYPD
ncbi:MAG: hypothetical protein MOGMAGMI_01529 [Candidatus Omnitrophica bacterium]|nr:hypothetical protein [Candidatus Omnitrophota bacterium]